MSIKRIVGKETTQYTLDQYANALANSSVAEKRMNIGELVLDIGTDPLNPTLYIANIDGGLNQIQGGNGGDVRRIIAGNNITITPSTGTGFVTINSDTNVQAIPAIYFTAPVTGNNQTFSNAELLKYVSNANITLFLNGSLLENEFYTLAGDTLTITTPIQIGDSIDLPIQYIVSNGGGAAGNPGGNNTSLQYNQNGVFGGVPNAGFDGNRLILGSNSDISINGGNNGQFLRTDGLGNLSWAAGGSGGNLLIITRTGNVEVPVTGGVLTVIGRTGNIPVVVG